VRTETVALTTIDGLCLEGDLALASHPAAGVVVAHPHPLYGGDRHNPVVDALFQALATAGLAVLRFDFRGVGRSEGSHDGGNAERLDVAAAVDLLEPITGDHPIVLAGYSFGGLVALDVVDPRVAGWFAAAPPLATTTAVPLAARDHRPKHLAVAEHDQFTPPPVAVELTTGWTATTVEVVSMADHFLLGRTGAVADSAVAFARRVV
jgi:alpha/beta superfamily hydrolase